MAETTLIRLIDEALDIADELGLVEVAIDLNAALVKLDGKGRIARLLPNSGAPRH